LKNIEQEELSSILKYMAALEEFNRSMKSILPPRTRREKNIVRDLARVFLKLDKVATSLAIKQDFLDRLAKAERLAGLILFGYLDVLAEDMEYRITWLMSKRSNGVATPPSSDLTLDREAQQYQRFVNAWMRLAQFSPSPSSTDAIRKRVAKAQERARHIQFSTLRAVAQAMESELARSAR
jgi:hypothetical protein